jgi:5-methylcytosine-specific restriction endonuclease McrA
MNSSGPPADEAECAICGREEGLEHHHKLKLRLGGPGQDWNLAVLCQECHPAVEALFPESFWRRALARYQSHLAAETSEAETDREYRECSECGLPWSTRELRAGVHTCPRE